MHKLKPISRVNLVDQVANQLAERISDGHWAQGQKLPSEPELCRALHIGRSTLREALKALGFVGMVRVRPGQGTYVADGHPALLGRILSRGLLQTEKDLEDLWETRTTLETKLVTLAAKRAGQEDLDALEGILNQMHSCLDQGERFTDLDLQFHFVIASSSKNRMLQELLVPIRSMMREWMEKSHQLPGKMENALREHRRILDAIHQRDPEKARKAMEEHLITFQRALSLLESISGRSAVLA